MSREILKYCNKINTNLKTRMWERVLGALCHQSCIFCIPYGLTTLPKFLALSLSFYSFSTYIWIYPKTYCSDLLVLKLHTNVILLYTVFFDLVFSLNTVLEMHPCSFTCIAGHYSIVWIHHKLGLHPLACIHLWFSKFGFICSFVCFLSLGTKPLSSINVYKGFSRAHK